MIAAPPGCERQLEAVAAEVAPALPAHGRAGRREPLRLGLDRAGGDAESRASSLVHDAARPLVTPELVDRCVDAAARTGAATGSWPPRARSTRQGGRCGRARDRDARAQPPVGGPDAAGLPGAGAARRRSRRGDLDRAYDDAQLVEAAGGDVRIVEAPRQNFKVTTPHDLRVAELLLEERADGSAVMLTDYHTHLRPDVARHAAGALLHRGQRAALPRGGRARGASTSSASPSTCYRFRQASTSGATRSGRSARVDDLDDYVEFVEAMKAPVMPVKLGLEVDYIPGREEQIAALIDGAPVGLRDRLGALHRRPRASTTTATTSG